MSTTTRPTDLALLRTPDYNSPVVEESFPRLLYLLYGIPFFLVVAYLIFVFIYRMKMEEILKNLPESKPALPKCGHIDENNFEFRGPLKLQSKFKGNVEHALMNEDSNPIEELVYDENLNEVVDIGSNVEEIEGISEITMSTKKNRRDTSTLFASKKSMKNNSRLTSMKAKALLRMRMSKGSSKRRAERGGSRT